MSKTRINKLETEKEKLSSTWCCAQCRAINSKFVWISAHTGSGREREAPPNMHATHSTRNSVWFVWLPEQTAGTMEGTIKSGATHWMFHCVVLIRDVFICFVAGCGAEPESCCNRIFWFLHKIEHKMNKWSIYTLFRPSLTHNTALHQAARNCCVGRVGGGER